MNAYSAHQSAAANDHRWYSLQAAESAVAATMLQWRGKQLLGVLTP